jgi:thioredoxin reductase (NADPH)
MKKVVVYGAEWCPDCRRANAFLENNNIEFEKIDVADDDNAKFVENINNGKRIIPTILIDDQPYTNPNNGELANILGLS